MNDIRFFNFDEDTIIRTAYTEDGEPVVCARDLALAMGLKKPDDAYDRIDHKYKVPVSTGTLGGTQQMLFLKEPGVYKLVMTTRLRKDNPYYDRIEAFQNWVCEDVLPSIRRTGKFEVGPKVVEAELIVEPSFEPSLKNLALLAPEAEAALRIAKVFGSLDGAEAQIRANRLMRSFHGIDVMESMGVAALPAPVESDLNATQIGERIGLSARQVNKLLLDLGYQTKIEGGNPPYLPTEKGKPYGRVVAWELGKEHDGPTKSAASQLRWFEKIVPVLLAHLAEQAA